MMEIAVAQIIVWIIFFHWEISTYLFWLVSPIIWKFLIIYACSSCSNEAKALNFLIDKQLNTCSNELVFSKISAVLSKMQLRPIVFHTGLFNIGWTMILPIFSAIITYIIIIVQFSSPKT